MRHGAADHAALEAGRGDGTADLARRREQAARCLVLHQLDRRQHADAADFAYQRMIAHGFPQTVQQVGADFAHIAQQGPRAR